jgi:hypothetical protein
VELGEAARCAAAAEEGGDRRGWAAGGESHAAAPASGQAAGVLAFGAAFFWGAWKC